MTPLEKAERAKALIEDPLFRAVIHDIRMSVVGALEASALDDLTAHHEAALTLQLLKRIPEMLQRYAQEIAVDKHRAQQQTFMDRIREKLHP